MSVKSCEKIEKSQVVLTIEVGAAEFEAAIEKAYQKMRRKINVPGFRPGKAPRKIIEGMYGAEVFFEEAMNIAFPEAYEAAVKEQELQVVGYPTVEIEGQVTKDGFTFKATAPVYPEVTLGQYKGLSAPKEEVKVSAADVDERLKTLTDRNTRLVSVEREAKDGDTVVIDFEGFLEGKPFDGGKGENYSLELGSHTFVPGFEEQLVGVKAGDEKDLDVTFPEDYHKDLAGKAVVFKVKVHEVKEKEVPALDDEFAKDVSEFDTLKDLKADLKKKITAEREETAKRAFEDALMEQVADNITADVPDAMVEAQARQYLDNFKMQLAQQGIQFLLFISRDSAAAQSQALTGQIHILAGMTRIQQRIFLGLIVIPPFGAIGHRRPHQAHRRIAGKYLACQGVCQPLSLLRRLIDQLHKIDALQLKGNISGRDLGCLHQIVCRLRQ